MNRRRKLALVSGIMLSAVLILLVYYMLTSPTPTRKPLPSGAPGLLPDPLSTYAGVGDSTADGTPVDGTNSGVVPITGTSAVPVIKSPTAPVVASPTAPVIKSPTAPVVASPTAPVIKSPTAPVVTAPTAPVIKSPTAPVVTANPPPVVIDCQLQKGAITDYYKNKTNTLLTPMISDIKPVNNSTCDVRFDLVIPGTTVITSVDSRRFTFTGSEIASMGGQSSGATITLPIVLSPPTTIMDAPPTDLITDYGKYFTKSAGMFWDTGTGNRSIVPTVQGCLKSCYDTIGCTGINYNTVLGQCNVITNAGNPVLSSSTGRDFYQRIPTKTVIPVYASQIAAGDTTNYLTQFTQNIGKYFSTGDITTINTNNAMDCAASCSKDVTCSGFNYWPGLYKCEMVRGYIGQPLNTHSAASFYKRNTMPTTPVFESPHVSLSTTRPRAYDDELSRFSRSGNYRILSPNFTYPNSRGGLSTGIRVSDAFNPTACAKACYNDWTCRGFNFNNAQSSCDLITTDVYPYPTELPFTGMDAYWLYSNYGWAPQIEPSLAQQTAPVADAVPITGGISINERCGPNFGETRCPKGLCCSPSSWCGQAVGTNTAWCINNGRGAFGGVYDGV